MTTSATIATTTPLQQSNGTSTAPIAFTGAASRSMSNQLCGFAAVSFVALVILCL
jgi:hypothetical protein